MGKKEEKVKHSLLAILGVLLFLAAAFLIKGYLDGHFRSVQTMRMYVSGFGFFAPLVLTLIQMLQVIVPVLPGFFGSIVGTGLFGAAGSFWCNYIGISAGSIVAYFLARWMGEKLVNVMISVEKYTVLVEWINRQKSYTIILFLAILLPLAPDDFLCYFSGLAGMSAKKFIWIILVAKPWCILFYSIFFEYFI